jgi:hypothetical protein
MMGISPIPRLAGRAAWLAVVLVPCLVLATCAAATGSPGHPRSVSGSPRLPLATSFASATGASWAIVDMGGSWRQGQNVWELFARAARAGTWRLATPGHIASGGGLVATSAGTPAGLSAGFVATRQLGFSPITSTADAGFDWSPGQPVTRGLAAAPDALAIGPRRVSLVLTARRQVLLLHAGTGPSWQLETDLGRLAHTAAGRACELTTITAIAFTTGGVPLVAGNCGRAGVAGLFEHDRGAWQLAAIRLPSGATAVSVLSMTTAGDQTTAVLRIGSSGSGRLVAVRRSTSGQWTSSAALSIGAATVQSAAIWPAGAAAVVLSDQRGAVLPASGADWQQLGRLPARTATLASGPSGQLEALAPHGQRLRVWMRHGSVWELVQSLGVGGLGTAGS